MNEKSSKIKKLIVVVLLFLIVNIVPVEARRSYHGRITFNDGDFIKVLLFMWILPATMIIYVVLYNRSNKKKILNMQEEIKLKLKQAGSDDSFWDEARLKKEIKHCFVKIQIATIADELELLEQCITPALKNKWDKQNYWQEHYNNGKWLKNREILEMGIVDLYDDKEDDNLDYFWVFIETGYEYQIYRHGHYHQNHDFKVELWKFIRFDNQIYLDSIMSKKEFVKKC